jgi:extracellular elastinolytic metalloproteinase
MHGGTSRRWALLIVVALTVGLLPTGGAAKTVRPGRSPSAELHEAPLDVRRPIASQRTLVAATAAARAHLGSSLGNQAVFELDPRTGTPRVVARLDGFLTEPSALPAADVAMGFVTDHLDAFGLSRADLRTFVLVRDYVDVDGSHHLSWEQQARGIPAFDSGLEASVTVDGRLVNVTGSPAAGLGRGGRTIPGLPAAVAIGRARTAVGAPATGGPDDTATLVWFHAGRSHLAWQTFTNVSDTRRHLSVVDATDGRLLWRTNLVHEATGHGLAWQYFPGSEVPGGGGEQQPVTFPVNGNGALKGPNAHVYLDLRDDSRSDPRDQIPSSGSWTWDAVAQLRDDDSRENCFPEHPCTWDKDVPKSWRANLRQNAVQVYWYLNEFHDHLRSAPIGFTTAAGNLEGADRVRAEVLDGAATDGGLPDPYHYNNANMFTPPDGAPAVMQMYLFRKDRFQPGWPSANAGDDASIVYHEYTHALSSRLVTYPNGIAALNSWQSAAMGEGWSDFYAMDLLVERGVVLDTAASGEVVAGQWITGGEGIRFQATDCAVGAGSGPCPAGFRTGHGGFTYGDYGKVYGEPQVHSDGEIWAQTLWDLREAVGVVLARRLITRGMELSPSDPSFLDMRNAIIQADLVATGGANADALWDVFRGRGMGYFASVVDGNDVTPVESFAAPPSCDEDPCGTIKGRITDSNTRRPVRRVRVSIGGLGSGGPTTTLSATTDGDGRYVLRHVPHHTYRDIVIDRWGLEPTVLHGITVDGTVILNRRVVRDWAAIDGGAGVVSFTPPDYSEFGCGPEGAFDRTLGAGWGSDAPNSTFGSFKTGPRSVVVELPRAIDITSFAIDPGATCGDGPAAALKAFDISTRTRGGKWILAARRTKALPQGVLTRVIPSTGTANVRYVKLTMRSNRGDPYFMDVSELSVRGR